jgi:ribonucleotide monophosphatase NagD (HAD superfamily)
VASTDDAGRRGRLPPPAARERPLRAVAFDLDGTLYLGNEAVPGAPQMVRLVRGSGLTALFLTNSTTADAARLADRLAKLGIAAMTEEIYSSATATARYVAERGFGVAYVVGSPGLRGEVAARGLRLTGRGAEAQVLVVGYVPGFDAATLPDDFRPGCEFGAANLDIDYPVAGGARLPACRQTVERVAARLGRGHDVVVGNPETYLLECVERDLGLTAGEIVVVGDSAASDVAMANAAGCRSILIAPQLSADGGASATISRLTDLPAALDVLTGS